MIGTELIINFKNNKAYLTETFFLPISQLDLPEFSKQSNSVASWKIKVLDYSDREIFAEVLSYSSSKQLFSEYQFLNEDKLSKIEKIRFRTINTLGLLQTLKADKTKTIFSPSKSQTSHSKYELISKNIKEVVSIPINDIYFKSGYVSFEKRIANLENPIEFRVYNKHIREEFDAIKNYFANALKIKKFQFDITASIINKEIEDVTVISVDIDSIDEFVKSIYNKNVEEETEKILLTIDELFDVLTENKIKASVFFEDEKSFFEDLLNVSNTKHYKQLRFLSDRHYSSIMKLRFIVKPFSFIFLIQGENKFYIVWETLNTAEATYIWQEDKDVNSLKAELKKIDDIIKNIKMFGKKKYLSKTSKNFYRIYHDYSDSVNGFIKWKSEIEKKMI